jgi:hypothetical protein
MPAFSPSLVIGSAVNNVEPGFKAHGRGRPVRAEEAQVTDLRAGKVTHDAPMLRSKSLNSMIQPSKYRRICDRAELLYGAAEAVFAQQKSRGEAYSPIRQSRLMRPVTFRRVSSTLLLI